MRDAGQSDLEPGHPRAADDFVGRCGRREVEIDRRLAEREIAHRSAHKSNFLAPSVERFQCLREGALPEERLIFQLSFGETRKVAHSKRPGTRTPFSTCAGM